MLEPTYYALIMAGGFGTRFAPLSTPEKPKQFLNLLDPAKSLLQQTYGRLAKQFDPAHILIATNRRYLSLVQEQLSQMLPQNIFDETHKKNTAPCLAWVSRQLWLKDKKAVIAALPADHFITPDAKFIDCLQSAMHLAREKQKIVLIGIQPSHPSAEYGYIHAPTATFVEKPDVETAKRYINEGGYLWNSGIFVFPAPKMLELIEKYQPKIFALLKSTKTLEDFFEAVPSISIDYGVMEKTKDLMVIPATFEWSDVGTWESLKLLKHQRNLILPKEIEKYLHCDAAGSVTTALSPPHHGNFKIQTSKSKTNPKS